MMRIAILLSLLLPLQPLTAPAQEPDGNLLPENKDKPTTVQPIDPVPAIAGGNVPFGSPEGLFPTLPESITIRHDGAIEFDNAAGTLHYAGNVSVKSNNGIQIFADDALLDTKAKSITLTGNVSVYQGAVLQRGDRCVYFYERDFLDASGLRASIDPVLLESGRFTMEDRNGKTVFVGSDAGITTHDVEDPNYWIRSDTTTIYPGDKITFRNLKLYAGDTPVFWLPYLAQPLDAELGYHFVPGARSSWGPYLLNSYGIMLGGNEDPSAGEVVEPWLLSRWHFDLRARRGAAVGVDLRDIRLEDNENLTGLQLYYAYDLDPSISRNGLPRTGVSPDRFRLDFQHIAPFTTWDKSAEYDARFNFSILSDRYLLEDFDPERFRTDPEPDSTIGLFRRTDDSLLGLFARLQLNEFQQTASRLPELFFDQVRRPLWDGAPLYHQGQTSIGVYREDLADYQSQNLLAQLYSLPPGDPRAPALAAALRENGFQRFHTYQEFSMPTNPGGWISLTPSVGVGYTNYWAVNGPATSDDSVLLHAGMEASVKFSRAYPEIRNHSLGLDGLMHAIQPYLGYSWVSTDQLDPSIPSIDRLTFTTRPRPISVGSFTAIDDIKDWSIIRAGTSNRFITKRDGENFEWLLVDTYIDAFLKDPELNREFSNLHNDIRWRPVPWATFHLETQFPVVSDGSSFSEVVTGAHFMPNENLDLAIGYRMLDNHPVLVDSNRIDIRAYARLNENWGIGFLHLWELDDGTLEVQQYTLHRDLGNWTAGVGFTKRDNRLEDEYGLIFSFTLKDFPSVSVPFSIDAE